MSGKLHLGTRKGLFELRRKSTGWGIERIDFLGQPVTMLLEDHRDGALYACLTLGHFGAKLRRSDDGGANWTELSVPSFREGDLIPIPSFDQDAEPSTKSASLSEIWSLEPAGDDNTDSLWAGTIPGALFRSDDRGETWELNEPLWNRPERMDWFGGGKDESGLHSICVDPRDSNHVTIAVSCGGVWDSTDLGHSWTLLGEGLRAEFMPPEQAGKKSIQDAHRLAHCNANPDVMWVQHHNGIFHSTDGSKHYREIEKAGPSTFGFAVCAHPHDENTAWFVPGEKDECRVPVDGKLVVTRTKDGGQTFETLRSGLPQQNCYDIVFRHALDVDASGNLLVMGSSTGGLWISENGGDHWQCVSNVLPPIYTARFSRQT